jgi:hypothetical protein
MSARQNPEDRMSIPDGYMQDAQGRLVPKDSVKPEHLLEDEIVRQLMAEARCLSGILKMFRETAQESVRSYLEVLAQEHGAKRGGVRGNVTLISYDGMMRVQVAIGDTLSFGPELQVAKSLIDECLRSWTDGARSELRALIEDVFQVGKAGKLDVDRILGLRRLDIDDERWKRAMAAIGDAVRVVTSKEYIRFYARPTPDADFVQVPLDLARV